MTLSPTIKPVVWDDPIDVIEFVKIQSTVLRHKFGELIMRRQLNPQEDVALAPAVMATYKALCASTYMPDYLEIRKSFTEQNMNLFWIFGLNFKTPGNLFETLPLTENLVIPLDKITEIRATLALKILQ